MYLKFAKNGIFNNTLTDLFPENTKEHQMNTRNVDKYKVNFANTEKLKHASIITMQKLLNEDAKKAEEPMIGHSVLANYDCTSTQMIQSPSLE